MTPYLTNLQVRNPFIVESEPSDQDIERASMQMRRFRNLAGRALSTRDQRRAEDFLAIYNEAHAKVTRLMRLREMYRNRLTWGSDE